MEEALEFKKQVKDLEQQVATLEQELGKYQLHGAIGFYYELNRSINNAVGYLKGKDITSFMSGDKDDKTFERMVQLMKITKENVESLGEMEKLFSIITQDEDADKGKRIPFVERLAQKKIV